MKPVVLLTATINPGAYMELLINSTPETRAQTYVSTLLFWLHLKPSIISGIVFCENSGVDLVPIAKQLKQLEDDGSNGQVPIEWLSFNGNHRPDGMHYGYSELGTIDYALLNSRLLQASEYFIKATGRLTFPCLPRLIKRLPASFDFAGDYHRYKQDIAFPYRMRTQLFLSRVRFYKKNLLQIRDKMDKGASHVEELLAKQVWPLQTSNLIVLRFPCECPPRGVSASFGSQYHKGISRVKSILRGIIRRVIPGIWL